jgi:hypothetical protein
MISERFQVKWMPVRRFGNATIKKGAAAFREQAKWLQQVAEGEARAAVAKRRNRPT